MYSMDFPLVNVTGLSPDLTAILLKHGCELTVLVSMKGFRILFSVTTGLVTYLLLSIFLGHTGILEYQKLNHYQEQLSANIGDLDKINSRLQDRIQSLQSDPQAVTVLARNLGYFTPNEGMIWISGYNPEVQVTSPGKIVYRQSKEVNRKPIFRVIAFSISILTYLVLLMEATGFQFAGQNPFRRGRGGFIRRILRRREHMPI